MNNGTDKQHTSTSPIEAIPTTHNDGSPWWKSADNPPCPDWCTEQHTAGEFAQGGSIVHQAVVVEGDGVTLTRVAIVSEAGDADTYSTDYDEVEVTTDRKGVQLSSADGFGVPLATAVSLAREVLALAEATGVRR